MKRTIKKLTLRLFIAVLTWVLYEGVIVLNATYLCDFPEVVQLLSKGDLSAWTMVLQKIEGLANGNQLCFYKVQLETLIEGGDDLICQGDTLFHIVTKSFKNIENQEALKVALVVVDEVLKNNKKALYEKNSKEESFLNALIDMSKSHNSKYYDRCITHVLQTYNDGDLASMLEKLGGENLFIDALKCGFEEVQLFLVSELSKEELGKQLKLSSPEGSSLGDLFERGKEEIIKKVGAKISCFPNSALLDFTRAVNSRRNSYQHGSALYIQPLSSADKHEIMDRIITTNPETLNYANKDGEGPIFNVFGSDNFGEDFLCKMLQKGASLIQRSPAKEELPLSLPFLHDIFKAASVHDGSEEDDKEKDAYFLRLVQTIFTSAAPERIREALLFVDEQGKTPLCCLSPADSKLFNRVAIFIMNDSDDQFKERLKKEVIDKEGNEHLARYLDSLKNGPVSSCLPDEEEEPSLAKLLSSDDFDEYALGELLKKGASLVQSPLLLHKLFCLTRSPCDQEEVEERDRCCLHLIKIVFANATPERIREALLFVDEQGKTPLCYLSPAHAKIFECVAAFINKDSDDQFKAQFKQEVIDKQGNEHLADCLNPLKRSPTSSCLRVRKAKETLFAKNVIDKQGGSDSQEGKMSYGKGILIGSIGLLGASVTMYMVRTIRSRRYKKGESHNQDDDHIRVEVYQ